MSFRTRVKWLLFPGLNLHSRLRYRRLPQFFGASADGSRHVLDAGSGNGMLSYQSYLKGNQVVGVSFKENEVQGSRTLFHDHLGIPEERLRFIQGNLYSLDFPDESFDEIICAEVLEHLRNDQQVCETFFRLLKPGGVLHVCAPNAHHPYNETFPLDDTESGGHVRAGYTAESYRQLLEPLGFELGTPVGLGGPIRQAFSRKIKEAQTRFGPMAGIPLFLVSIPALLFENHSSEHANPFSIYICTRKPL